MVKYNTIDEILDMIENRLEGFSSNETVLIKNIALRSYDIGKNNAKRNVSAP